MKCGLEVGGGLQVVELPEVGQRHGCGYGNTKEILAFLPILVLGIPGVSDPGWAIPWVFTHWAKLDHNNHDGHQRQIGQGGGHLLC